MVNIDDRTAFENERIDLWACDYTNEPKFMYLVEGEYETTLIDFWSNYNQFPLKVIHNFVSEFDDLHDDDKLNRFRIDEVHSIKELNKILEGVEWKLAFDDFFITNSLNEVKLEIQVREGLKDKEFPIFDLDSSDTLTEVILHGDAFIVGTNDISLSKKEQLHKVILL